MDNKYPLRKLFGLEAAETPDAGEKGDRAPPEFRVPTALNAIASAYFNMLNHAYGLTYALVVPGCSDTLDEDTVYALTFFDGDAPATESAQLGRFFADIRDIEHFIADPHERHLHAESLTDLVLGYAAIARNRNVPLDLPYSMEGDGGLSPMTDALEAAYVAMIGKHAQSLAFLHDVPVYTSRAHLATHYRRSASVEEAENLTPYYSYRDLLRLAHDYDIAPDLKCLRPARHCH